MNPIRITGDKKINKSFEDIIQKAKRDFGIIRIRPQKDDGYGLNMDSINDSVEEFIEN